jgi:two-component system nitrate/nitrite response regulator NarL
MSEPIRVMIADDHPLFREGVVHSLASEPDLVVVGQATNGQDALRLSRDLLPDVALLDIGMPGWDGLATAEKITTACPATKIVMLTVFEDEDKLLAAFKAGARGYVLKGVSARELASVVRNSARGDVYVSPSLAAGMLMMLTRQQAADPLEELTEREREILMLVGKALTNREIGERLHLSEKTVKHYITNILAKLQLRSRVDAALLAQRRVASRDKHAAPLSSVIKARQVVHAVAPGASVIDCVRTMVAKRIGCLVVMDADRLIGIFTERDALTRVLAAGRDPGSTKVSDVMTPDPSSVSPATTVRAALELITVRRFRHLPVVEKGKLLAVVSSGDLTHWLVEDQLT